jgi:hypothetical protein
MIDIDSPGGSEAGIKSAIEAILNTGTGTSFPGSPSTGDKFWRSDRNIEYFWDGTRWLSTQLFLVSPYSTENASADTASGRLPVPFKGIYDLWIEKVQTSSYLSATASWNLNLRWSNAANTYTDLASHSTTGDAATTWVNKETNVNAVLDSNALLLNLFVDEVSGTAGCYCAMLIYFRLIG